MSDARERKLERIYHSTGAQEDFDRLRALKIRRARGTGGDCGARADGRLLCYCYLSDLPTEEWVCDGCARLINSRKPLQTPAQL